MKRRILVVVLACAFGSGSTQAVGQSSLPRQLRAVGNSPRQSRPAQVNPGLALIAPEFSVKNKWRVVSGRRTDDLDGVFLTANYAKLLVWMDKGGRILVNNDRQRFYKMTEPQKYFVLTSFRRQNRMDLYGWLLHDRAHRLATYRYFAVAIKQQNGGRLNIPATMLDLTPQEQRELYTVKEFVNFANKFKTKLPWF